MDLNELRQKRAQLIAQARAVLERAQGGVMSAEDEAEYDRLFSEANKLADTIKRTEQQAEAERGLAEPATRALRPGGGQEGIEGRGDNPRASAEYRRAFDAFLRGGWGGLAPAEHRALQSDINTQGGYLVTPTQFVEEMLQAVDNAVFIRQWATKHQVPSAQSLGVPSLEADPADPTWTAELATGTEDGSMKFGKRELLPHPLAKRVKLSNKLLRQVPNAEALVRARLGYKFGVTMEANYLIGNGAGQPLGVFVASTDGIPTTRDVSADNTATAVTADGLINAKYALKGQYWPKARWMFHRDVLKTIAKLKDTANNYIWRESVRAGEPDTLLGLPVFMSEYAPSTMTSGLYVGILGDFSFYWIADATDMQVQRLVELYAETNQVGLIGRLESDGMPVLAEAFVRVKLG